MSQKYPERQHKHPPSPNVLPDYVTTSGTIDPLKRPEVLRTPANLISFPLDAATQEALQTLETKFDQEKNMAGLAAVQIGIPLQAIIFSVPDDAELKRYRLDLTQSMEKTLWLNPEYEGIPDEGQITDIEACFSVNDVFGEVSRFHKIRYKAYLRDGTPVNGTAEGFLARVIQHEIDHVKGKLFPDRISDKKHKLYRNEDRVSYREEKLKKQQEQGKAQKGSQKG